MSATRFHVSVLALAALVAACQRRELPVEASTVTRNLFGELPDGREVYAFTLDNGHGVRLEAITYGGIIVSLETPDRDGRRGDVVLGYDDLSGYLKETPYFGAIIGRYGNRIGNAEFALDGQRYRLAANNGPNHLHGGVVGFDKVLWAASPFARGDSVGVVFRYTSPDGEEGYPGELAATVTYTLTTDGTLVFDYQATTDKPTPVNLTQHSYFNLAGDGARDVLDHVLTIYADGFTPVDSTLIPTGAIAPVAGTPFDFRMPMAVGARIGAADRQLDYGGGYDHNFVLDPSGDGLAHAAHVYEPTTGRTLDIYTTEPGLQFYSGNFLDGSLVGKSGHVYDHRYGFCLETQHYPDSPNKPGFPSTILRPGEEYRSRTVLKFGVGQD
jgi:aldose 1-epimerase